MSLLRVYVASLHYLSQHIEINTILDVHITLHPPRQLVPPLELLKDSPLGTDPLHLEPKPQWILRWTLLRSRETFLAYGQDRHLFGWHRPISRRTSLPPSRFPSSWSSLRYRSSLRKLSDSATTHVSLRSEAGAIHAHEARATRSCPLLKVASVVPLGCDCVITDATSCASSPISFPALLISPSTILSR